MLFQNFTVGRLRTLKLLTIIRPHSPRHFNTLSIKLIKEFLNSFTLLILALAWEILNPFSFLTYQRQHKPIPLLTCRVRTRKININSFHSLFRKIFIRPHLVIARTLRLSNGAVRTENLQGWDIRICEMAEATVFSKGLLCCHKHSAGASANLTRFLDMETPQREIHLVRISLIS
jgi:hypothetical protein